MKPDTNTDTETDRTDDANEQDDDTRLADELSKIYDVLEDCHEEARTQREEAVLGLLYILTDYGRDVALQREFPTPNQLLYAGLSDEEPEEPADPGFWPDFAGDHDNFGDLVEWTDPEHGEVPVDGK